MLFLTAFGFGQSVISTFSEDKNDLYFIDYLNSESANYALILEDSNKIKTLYWKEFDRNFVDTSNKIEFKVNGKSFGEFFPEDAAMIIETTDNPVKTVKFLSSKDGEFIYYEGKTDVNNLQNGVYDVDRKYIMDLKEYKNRHYIYIHDDQFIFLGLNPKQFYAYYPFTPEKGEIKNLTVPDKYSFANTNRTIHTGTILQPGISSRYFPDMRSFFFTENDVFFISPKDVSGNEFRVQNPIEIVSFNLETRFSNVQKIDLPDAKTVDYAVVENKMFIAAESKEGVKVYEYHLFDGNLKEIASIPFKEKSEFEFVSNSYYMDGSRNETEASSSDKWKSSMFTLVLDVDQLDNGMHEFTIAGAKYRDPNGFVKLMGSVLIASVTATFTGVGLFPMMGYSNLQPLLTSTTFVMNPADGSIQPAGSFQSHDFADKFMENNGYFRGKTFVGQLSDNVMIYQEKDTNRYLVIDFSQQNNLPEK